MPRLRWQTGSTEHKQSTVTLPRSLCSDATDEMSGGHCRARLAWINPISAL
jgi:hypothetical protein